MTRVGDGVRWPRQGQPGDVPVVALYGRRVEPHLWVLAAALGDDGALYRLDARWDTRTHTRPRGAPPLDLRELAHADAWKAPGVGEPGTWEGDLGGVWQVRVERGAGVPRDVWEPWATRWLTDSAQGVPREGDRVAVPGPVLLTQGVAVVRLGVWREGVVRVCGALGLGGAWWRVRGEVGQGRVTWCGSERDRARVLGELDGGRG
jgi:hypothetical protein